MTPQAHEAAVAEPVRPSRRGTTEVAEWYRRRLGWPVEITDERVHLTLTGGLVAFEVPAHLAGGVLQSLTDLGAVGPALRTGQDHDRVAFLCDVNDAVFTQSAMPLGVKHLRAPASLPLPSPRPSHSWLVPPQPDHGWLPSADAVLHAVLATSAAAAAGMSHHQAPPRRLAQARPQRGVA